MSVINIKDDAIATAQGAARSAAGFFTQTVARKPALSNVLAALDESSVVQAYVRNKSGFRPNN